LGPHSCISQLTKIFVSEIWNNYNESGWQNRVKSVLDSTEHAPIAIYT
jgi:hypothetical protein